MSEAGLRFWISLVVSVFLLVSEAMASWFFTVLIVFLIFPPLSVFAFMLYPLLVFLTVILFLVITDFGGSLEVGMIEWIQDLNAYNGLLSRSLRLANKFGVYVDRLGIAPYKRLNAFSYGIIRPKIVIFRGLLEELDSDEMDFVIAHELAHIKHRWVWIIHNFANAVSFLPLTTPPPIVFILYITFIPVRLAFLWFLRECEFVADREALRITGNVVAAVRALAKLVRMGNVYDIEELDRIVCDRDLVDKVFNDVIEMLSGHPLIKRRVREILREYQKTSLSALNARIYTKLV